MASLKASGLPVSADVSPHDMDVCITYIANTLELSGIMRSVDRVFPFALAFLGLTPFKILARFLSPGRPSFALTMNVLQRIIFYLGAYVSVGGQHQRLHYPATLQDKHGVANMLCAVYPGLEAAVEELRRRLKFERGRPGGDIDDDNDGSGLL